MNALQSSYRTLGAQQQSRWVALAMIGALAGLPVTLRAIGPLMPTVLEILLGIGQTFLTFLQVHGC
jgi:hypothetical protein